MNTIIRSARFMGIVAVVAAAFASSANLASAVPCDAARLPITGGSAGAIGTVDAGDGVMAPVQAATHDLPVALTDHEKYMIARAVAHVFKHRTVVAAMDVAGLANERAGGGGLLCSLRNCPSVHQGIDVTGIAWNKGAFWGAIGTGFEGCETADNYKTRIAVDYDMGIVQLGTRTHDATPDARAQYRRIALDFCNCQARGDTVGITVHSGLGYRADTTAAQKTEDALDAFDAEAPRYQGLPSALQAAGALNATNKLTLATLGWARKWGGDELGAVQGLIYRYKVQYAILLLKDRLRRRHDLQNDRAEPLGGIITGGYSGLVKHEYGINQFGNTIAHDLNWRSIVVMPTSGLADIHPDAEAVSPIGLNWGDETAALVALTDFALVFYRSSVEDPATSMGRWTQVEVEHLVAQEVPYLLIDLDHADFAAYVSGLLGSVDRQVANPLLDHAKVRQALHI